mmetsp:Transcript_18041/g.69809  ORF Transcript_18041/g.69809 Transcript_18041/m.69809 type:complete len:351 (+) Transcript_18041:1754-2806(+)
MYTEVAYMWLRRVVLLGVVHLLVVVLLTGLCGRSIKVVVISLALGALRALLHLLVAILLVDCLFGGVGLLVGHLVGEEAVDEPALRHHRQALLVLHRCNLCAAEADGGLAERRHGPTQLHHQLCEHVAGRESVADVAAHALEQVEAALVLEDLARHLAAREPVRGFVHERVLPARVLERVHDPIELDHRHAVHHSQEQLHCPALLAANNQVLARVVQRVRVLVLAQRLAHRRRDILETKVDATRDDGVCHHLRRLGLGLSLGRPGLGRGRLGLRRLGAVLLRSALLLHRGCLGTVAICLALDGLLLLLWCGGCLLHGDILLLVLLLLYDLLLHRRCRLRRSCARAAEVPE